MTWEGTGSHGVLCLLVRVSQVLQQLLRLPLLPLRGAEVHYANEQQLNRRNAISCTKPIKAEEFPCAIKKLRAVALFRISLRQQLGSAATALGCNSSARLQPLGCNSSAATARLQQLGCNSSAATARLQQLGCNSSAATARLQQLGSAATARLGCNSSARLQPLGCNSSAATARLQQLGCNSSAATARLGCNSSARLQQLGSAATARLQQLGCNSSAATARLGCNSSARLQQLGSAATARFGCNSSARLQQLGSAATARLGCNSSARLQPLGCNRRRRPCTDSCYLYTSPEGVHCLTKVRLYICSKSRRLLDAFSQMALSMFDLDADLDAVAPRRNGTLLDDNGPRSPTLHWL